MLPIMKDNPPENKLPYPSKTTILLQMPVQSNINILILGCCGLKMQGMKDILWHSGPQPRKILAVWRVQNPKHSTTQDTHWLNLFLRSWFVKEPVKKMAELRQGFFFVLFFAVYHNKSYAFQSNGWSHLSIRWVEQALRQKVISPPRWMYNEMWSVWPKILSSTKSYQQCWVMLSDTQWESNSQTVRHNITLHVRKKKMI